MRYPEYFQHDKADGSIVGTYIDYVANEITDQALPIHPLTDQLMNVSWAIGELCWTKAAGEEVNTATTQLIFDTLTDEKAATISCDSDPSEPQMLGATAAMIVSDRMPERIADFRDRQHRLAVSALAQAIQAAPERGGSPQIFSRSEELAVGSMSHYTGLALLTRLQHPRVLAVPALPHQNYRMGHGTPANYDICVIEQGQPVSSETPDNINNSVEPSKQIYKVQIKAVCIGDCHIEAPVPQDFSVQISAKQMVTKMKYLEKKKQAILSRYHQDIVVVSGCCDLNLGMRTKETRYRVAELLCAEYTDGISAKDTAYLDTLSNGLLLTITGDSGRRGLLPLPKPHASKQYVPQKKVHPKPESQDTSALITSLPNSEQRLAAAAKMAMMMRSSDIKTTSP